MSDGPKITDQVRSLARVVADSMASGKWVAEPEVLADRYRICRACELFGSRDSVEVCQKCGCKLANKLKANASKCPIGKW